MSAYETFECSVCEEPFVAYPDANAAQGGYCSPACEVEGEGLR